MRNGEYHKAKGRSCSTLVGAVTVLYAPLHSAKLTRPVNAAEAEQTTHALVPSTLR
jgi:hypothetical protein